MKKSIENVRTAVNAKIVNKSSQKQLKGGIVESDIIDGYTGTPIGVIEDDILG